MRKWNSKKKTKTTNLKLYAEVAEDMYNKNAMEFAENNVFI